MMENKFFLDRQESIFLAKKKLDENVYCGMRMENRAVTFPQTQTILNGINVASVGLDDITAILNMRDAWKYLLDTVDEPVTLSYMCRLNGFIARNEALEWGTLRSGNVGISGTEYLPPVPAWDKSEQELGSIMHSGVSATERALNVFAWGTRSQLFWDGNKRTSLSLANKILISEGAGILTITDSRMEQFNMLLLNYYDTGNDEELKQFLYDYAIHGLTK